MPNAQGAVAVPDLPDPRSAEFADRFGSHLVAQGLLDELAVARAQRAQRQSGERFPQVLLHLGILDERGLARALASFCSLDLADSSRFPDTALRASEIDVTFLRRHHVLPIREDGGSLVIAAADPLNGEAVAALAFLLEQPVAIEVATYADIEAGLDRLYDQGGTVAGTAKAGRTGVPAEVASDEDVRRLQDMASDAPVIRLLQELITRAAGMQASDIHVEPREDSVRVRFRIDGVLHTVETLPTSLRAALGSRIKIEARLNIAEQRLPQDGRMKANVRGREIDLRVSTMPTLWGESIVLRILDRSAVELDLGKLGFAGELRRELTDLLRQPNGIVLVTGPTGSGKTTTLYTALELLNSAERKIFTVEDPIEYQMMGINQIQVQPRIGLNFAHALRSILRQDPDIIMVGEIRDLETAQIAVQASLTGHLVLSTVHTNSAAATITRLIDMGVERYLLASSLKGVLAQRLVRRLCPACAAPSPDNATVLSLLAATGADPETLLEGRPPRLSRAVGCPACRNTGFAGRTTIAELLTVGPVVRKAMLAGASDEMVQEAGMAGARLTLLQNGLLKALLGETTAEEVLRATRFDTCQDIDSASTT